jgi:hypothetical protein
MRTSRRFAFSGIRRSSRKYAVCFARIRSPNPPVVRWSVARQDSSCWPLWSAINPVGSSTHRALSATEVGRQARAVALVIRNSTRHGGDVPFTLSLQEFVAWREQSRSFEMLAAVDHAATGAAAIAIAVRRRRPSNRRRCQLISFALSTGSRIPFIPPFPESIPKRSRARRPRLMCSPASLARRRLPA